MWLELKSGSCDAWAMDQEGVYDESLGGYIVPSNPWFDAAVDSPHGPIEFIRFQAGLEAIARYLDLLEGAVGRSLAEERAAFERRDFLARAPSGWEGEAELVASEVLAENEDFLPPFAYGSTLALCFTVFERLLRDLVTLTEDQTSHSLKAFARRRGEPYIAHAQRFLEATFGTDIGVDDETAAELDRLRRLRNRFVHELAEPSSGQPSAQSRLARRLLRSIAARSSTLYAPSAHAPPPWAKCGTRRPGTAMGRLHREHDHADYRYVGSGPAVDDESRARDAMRTLGIDLAAEPISTAACEITWHADVAYGRLHGAHLDDDHLLALIQSADKAGIDCPFGWPQPFVDAVSVHTHGAAWPGRGQPGAPHRRSLRYRLTDEIVREQLNVVPLSVSTDRIGVTAMRCAALLDALAVEGQPVDRAGSGRVVEVYPAAALKHWGLAYRGYKNKTDVTVRDQALHQILVGLPTLILEGDALDRCRHSDDAFDALACALVARGAALGLTMPPSSGRQTERARVEGWIHLPTSDLTRLQRP